MSSLSLINGKEQEFAQRMSTVEAESPGYAISVIITCPQFYGDRLHSEILKIDFRNEQWLRILYIFVVSSQALNARVPHSKGFN